MPLNLEELVVACGELIGAINFQSPPSTLHYVILRDVFKKKDMIAHVDFDTLPENFIARFWSTSKKKRVRVESLRYVDADSRVLFQYGKILELGVASHIKLYGKHSSSYNLKLGIPVS